MSTSPKYTLLLFFKRNPSMSITDFKEYYESNHVPMVMEHAKTSKGLLRYTRRYIDHEASNPSLNNPFTVFGTPAPTLDFDIVNEVTFDTKENARRYADAFYGVAENAEKTIAEENKLFIRNQMRGMIVEEIASIQ
jgi:hypothetical protein